MIQAINTTELHDAALIDYDQMMIECITNVAKFAALATWVWGDVLRELDKRGKVRLTAGSYDDIGNALIQRLY